MSISKYKVSKIKPDWVYARDVDGSIPNGPFRVYSMFRYIKEQKKGSKIVFDDPERGDKWNYQSYAIPGPHGHSLLRN